MLLCFISSCEPLYNCFLNPHQVLECCINCTKAGALACAVTSTRHSLPSPWVTCLSLVLEVGNRIAEIKGLLWHFGNYCCFLHLQFLPLGSFPFVLFFLCCLKGLVYTVTSSQVCLGKEFPPAPLRGCKRSPHLQAATFRKGLEISLRSPCSSLPTRVLML